MHILADSYVAYMLNCLSVSPLFAKSVCPPSVERTFVDIDHVSHIAYKSQRYFMFKYGPGMGLWVYVGNVSQFKLQPSVLRFVS